MRIREVFKKAGKFVTLSKNNASYTENESTYLEGEVDRGLRKNE